MLNSLRKLLSSTSLRRYFSEENLIVATRKGFCESKTFMVIASYLKHKKKQNKISCFLSMSFKALTFSADVKRNVLKIQRHLITASNVMELLSKSCAYIMCSKKDEFLSIVRVKITFS